MSVLRERGWCIIASDLNWLALPKTLAPRPFRENISPEDFFQKLISFPENGLYAFHFECVVRAFSDKLFFCENGQPAKVLLGDTEQDEVAALTKHVGRMFPQWQLFVAFQLQGDRNP